MRPMNKGYIERHAVDRRYQDSGYEDNLIVSIPRFRESCLRITLWPLVRWGHARNILVLCRRCSPMGGTSAIIVIILLSIVIGLWVTDGIEQLTHSMSVWLTNLSVQIGFRLDDIRVVGRVRTPSGHIITALKLKRGAGIFSFDVQDSKLKLETLPWINSASVERRLPNTLRLTLVERKAVALWQRDRRYVLLDRDGTEIADDIAPFRHLPVVVGDQVPGQVQLLLLLVNSQPILTPRVRAAQLVSGRRWNLWLDDFDHGIEVRLPEERPSEALQRLVEFDREYSLLRHHLLMVDLRAPDRLVVRLEEHGYYEQVFPVTAHRAR